MFDLGWDEMALIAVVALVLLGPKELPNALRTVTGLMKSARKLAGEFQSGVNDIIREAELEDAKKAIASLNKGAIGDAIERHLDSDGEMKAALQKPTDEPVTPAASNETPTVTDATTAIAAIEASAAASDNAEVNVPEVNPAVAAFAPGGSATYLPDVVEAELPESADFGQKLDLAAVTDPGTHSRALVEGNPTATPVESGPDEALRHAAISSLAPTTEDRPGKVPADQEKSKIS